MRASRVLNHHHLKNLQRISTHGSHKPTPQVPDSKMNAHWDIRRLRKSTLFCNNIPPHKNPKTFEPRFIHTQYILHGQPMNPKSCIGDFIIGRVRHNHCYAPDAVQPPDMISIMVASRLGVAEKFKKLFVHAKPRPAIYFEDDVRQRIGLTLNVDELQSDASIDAIINSLDHEFELPFNFKQAYADLVAPIFVETDLLKRIYYDENFNTPYFDSKRSIMYLGSAGSNYLEDDAIIPKVLPAIHQTILNHDNKELAKILLADPQAALSKDPYGIEAHRLASMIGTHKQKGLLLKARQKCHFVNVAQFNELHNATRTYNEKGASLFRLSDDKRMQNRARYLQLITTPAPTRSRLHQACIDGELAIVIEEISRDQTLLNAQDPRGYTPALLAAANDHPHILQWLLNQGASHAPVYIDDVFSGRNSLRLIDNAFTARIIKIILENAIDPQHYSLRFMLAIAENDIELAETLMFYLKKFPTIRGLSFIDYALHISPENGSEMLKALLLAYDDFVQEGPYDKDIPAAAAQLLTEHNQKRERRLEKKSACVQIHAEELVNDCLVAELSTANCKLRSIIKRLDNVGNERERLIEIFKQNFSLIENNTEENLRIYIDNELSEAPNKPGFINLFYDETNNLIAYMTYQIIHTDEYSVFHGRLAASDLHSTYASQGLITLAFRAMIALKNAYHERKVYTYLEAIAPGFGFCAAVPHKIEFYPKFKMEDQLIQEIVRHSGEELRGNVIKTKLRVQRNITARIHDNFKLKIFSALTGHSMLRAMPICYEIKDDVKNAYLKMTATNGMQEAHLNAMVEYFKKHAPLSICNERMRFSKV